MIFSEQLLFRLQRTIRSLWLRPTIYALFAIAALVAGPFLDPLVPASVTGILDDGAVQSLLTTLASSMLAVAIFSLGTMAQAFQMAANAATPRARSLMMQDRTAQNAISTFIGAFLFSILGIVGLSLHLFGEGGRLTLFALAILLIAIVIVTLIGWLQRLSSMGGVEEVIDRVENAAGKAFANLAKAPDLGGQAYDGTPPKDTGPLTIDRFGYLQHIDTTALNRLAANADLELYLAVRPGAWIHPNRPLAYTAGQLDDAAYRNICKAFMIGGQRTHEADPRFGLILLGEIAARALSPGINDPGTAIDTIGTSTRLLADWRRKAGDVEPALTCNRLYVPALEPGPILRDAFGSILLNAAGDIVVVTALRRNLQSLAAVDPDFFGDASEALANDAIDLARDRKAEGVERDRLEESLKSVLDSDPGT